MNQIVLMLILMVIQPDYTKLRLRMVSEQIEARGIYDAKVLIAMKTVPRHLFVPITYKSYSYNDSPLPIGYGQTISQPYIVAYMTQALKLNSTDKVLEIGTGSGYQAAVLSLIVDSVYTIEIIPKLAKNAGITFDECHYDNVKCKTGDGYIGWQQHAPYDAIIITAAIDTLPQQLVDQLKEGGRLIVPIGSQHSSQYLQLYTKKRDLLKKKSLLPVRFVPFKRDFKNH